MAKVSAQRMMSSRWHCENFSVRAEEYQTLGKSQLQTGISQTEISKVPRLVASKADNTGQYRGLHQKSWTPSLVYNVQKVSQSPQSNIKISLRSTKVAFLKGKIP